MYLAHRLEVSDITVSHYVVQGAASAGKSSYPYGGTLNAEKLMLHWI